VLLVAILSAFAIANPADTHANTSQTAAAANSRQAAPRAHQRSATVLTSSDAVAPADRVPSHTEVHLKLNGHRSQTSPGHTITISGRVYAKMPKHLADTASVAAAVARRAISDVHVKLQMLRHGHWILAQHHRTNRNGRFVFRFRVRHTGITRLRILYLHNPAAHRTTAPAGRIDSQKPLVPTVASWYYDAGDTACGFHAYYGVANKTLPCGTKVRISYRGHSLMATVDDRGPFVSGRTYDLNQNVSRALGMYGVATVYASVG
jgi:rare lipoprotein A